MNNTLSRFTLLTLTFFLSLSPAISAEDSSPFSFNPEPLQLGKLEQGKPQKVVLSGKNISKRTIALEGVLSQNGYADNFQYPPQINPNKEFKISYHLDTRTLEGPFTHRIILIEKGGKPWITTVEGKVESPLIFSQKMLDIGFHQAGMTHKWTFYVWNPQGKTFTLALNAKQPNLHLSTESVLINTQDYENIREGGTTPGLKITLLAKGFDKEHSPTHKSIRQLIGFQSPQWPQARPEVLIVGYWKN